MNLHDTIVAISSAPGPAARGIVRLSGPDAHRLAALVFGPLDAAAMQTALPTVIDGHVRLDSSTLPSAAWLFAAPRSYTRQDMVELHLLGAPGVLGLVIEALIAAGARRAEAGEFTARAYLNGALDLAQVHGVAALIAAQSEGQCRAASRLLDGSLSKTAHAAREALADLLSLVEGSLDFADEPIEFISPTVLGERLALVSASLRQTLDASLQTERWGRAPRVLLAGRPNAGKSNLLNRLSGLDRAIATPMAGTTRDVLTAPLQLDDFSCVLVDSAGLSEPSAGAEGRSRATHTLEIDGLNTGAADSLDQLAMNATLAAAGDAEVIVWMVDPTEPASSWPRQFEALQKLWRRFPTGVLVVLNKSDISTSDHIRHWSNCIRDAGLDEPAVVSAATGTGCDDLQRRMTRLLKTRVEIDHETPIALLGEHHDALLRATQALDRALNLAAGSGDSLDDADLVALELHTAAAALGVLVGRDVPDDLLGRVFARFCVGK